MTPGSQTAWALTLSAADFCQAPESRPVGVEHYENFPVASVLCPARIRPAVVAIYCFARTADDIADEGHATPAQRLMDLADYRRELVQALNGTASDSRWPSVFTGLTTQILAFGLPAAPLYALLDAFVQDVHNPPYTNREQLLDYCRRSANPIGRLLMHLYGIDDKTALQRSDAVCSALQLINFWQDLSVDGPRGRLYVPLQDLQAHGLAAHQALACLNTPNARALVADLCAWAKTLMLCGAPLALTVPGRAGWELRLVVQGGLRILEKIAAMDHATMSKRPRLSAWDLPLLAWRAWRMQATLKEIRHGEEGPST